MRTLPSHDHFLTPAKSCQSTNIARHMAKSGGMVKTVGVDFLRFAAPGISTGLNFHNLTKLVKGWAKYARSNESTWCNIMETYI